MGFSNSDNSAAVWLTRVTTPGSVQKGGAAEHSFATSTGSGYGAAILSSFVLKNALQ